MVQPTIEVLADLAPAAAARLTDEITATIAARGRCRLALSGGGTPRPIYQALAQSAHIDWSAVHLFWADERCVPPDHEWSNYRMVRETLIDRLGDRLPRANIHRIAGELPPAEAAAVYARTLGEDPLDIVLLGMGDDGHTASLFPAMADLDPPVLVGTAPTEPRERVTLGLRAINRAGLVIFVIAGRAKASRLREVFDQIGAPILPAAKVQPSSGRLLWLIDAAAATELRT